MTDEEKEIWDIMADSRIKVLKERNPDYEEILSLLEEYSKKIENDTTFETVVENICIFCKGIFAISGTVFTVIFVISCIQKLLS